MTDQINTYLQTLEQASSESTLVDGKHRAYIAWLQQLQKPEQRLRGE